MFFSLNNQNIAWNGWKLASIVFFLWSMNGLSSFFHSIIQITDIINNTLKWYKSLTLVHHEISITLEFSKLFSKLMWLRKLFSKLMWLAICFITNNRLKCSDIVLSLYCQCTVYHDTSVILEFVKAQYGTCMMMVLL